MNINQITPVIMTSMSSYDRKAKDNRKTETKPRRKPEEKAAVYVPTDVYTPSTADDMIRQLLGSYQKLGRY